MRLSRLTAFLAACVIAAPQVSAQSSGNFDNSWFWGVKGGVNTFTSSGSGTTSAPTWGLDWLITRKQGGLYISADQSFFGKTLTATDANSANGTRQIKLHDLRRVGFAGVVFPGPFGALRPYAGVGAAISLIGSAIAQPDSIGGAPSQTFVDNTDKQRSRASLLVMAGAQFQVKRTAIFVQETVLPSGGDFLIRSAMSFFEVGIRYNFGSSIEGSR
ncbi:MAG: hypothetical protein M3Z17_06890 [Gemmatimonadota bacterium]|nr:hypothetical protein [Gemmatimonadota bacterium]